MYTRYIILCVCVCRGWRFVLSTLPALQNPSHRSLSSYQSRIIRSAAVCPAFFTTSFCTRMEIIMMAQVLSPACMLYNRWGRLRATMMPWPGLVEPFTECFGLGLLGALCLHRLLHIHPVLFLLVHTSVWFTFDLVLLKLIEVWLHILCVVGNFSERNVLANFAS